MLGDKDAIVDNEGSFLFHSKTQSKKKELVIYPNGYHELQKEPHLKTALHCKVLKFFGSILSDKSNLKVLGNYSKVQAALSFFPNRRRILSPKVLAMVVVALYLCLAVLLAKMLPPLYYTAVKDTIKWFLLNVIRTFFKLFRK